MLTRIRISLFLAVMLLSACAASKEAVQMRYLVPLPPEKPILEWLGTYSSADDFPKTDAQKRMEAIVGKPPLEMMRGPSGIAADGEGRVYISDIYMKNVWIYDLNAKTVSKLLEDSPESFFPRHIAIDSQKRLFIADSETQCVKIFSPTGQPLGLIGKVELKKPIGLAINERLRRLYVTDAAEHQVKVFDLDSTKFLFAFGKLGDGPGDFYSPAGLAVNSAGEVFVVELFNARISVFTPDGEFLHKFGERTDSLRGLENPRAAQFDSEGNLWLVDFRRGALRAYDPEGELLFAMEGNPDHKMGLTNPTALYIDSNDEIYVADFIGRRFAHWRFLSKKALAAHPVTKEEEQKVLGEYGGKAPAK